jgi:hypothetical protein
VTISNVTGESLKVTVAARPWVQSSSGAVVPNPRSTLAGVHVSAGSFTLASGASKSVTITLAATPKAGSIYGNVDVVGVPAAARQHTAVVVDYQLIASLRLDPSHVTYGAQAGGVVVSGTHARGELSLAVKNTGDTVAPIGGTVHVSGPRGAATATLTAIRILPGATVDLPVLALHGTLPAGSYTLSGTLTTSGHTVAHVSRPFTLR